MPEETVTYRVEIDDTDLGAQLDAVRQRIDTAVGATAMRAAELPKAQDLLANYPLLAKEFTAAPAGQFADQIDASFWSKVGAQTGPTDGGRGFMEAMTAEMDKAAETLQMGYTKFTDDLRVMGLLTRPAPYPTFQVPTGPGVPGDPGAWKDLIGGKYVPSIFGLLDSGFDYRGPVTPGEARRAAQYRTEERIMGFTRDWGWDIAGAAIGSVVAPGVGTLAGWTAGTIAEGVSDFLLSAERERVAIGEGLHYISRASGAGITATEAEDLASQIQDKFLRPEQRARGFDVQSAEEEIVAFANAGGFQNVRGIEQFRTTTMSLLNNFKQVAADMDMSFTEAAQFMGTLQQNMIATTENVSALTARMSNIANMTGMDVSEIAGIGLQGAQMTRQAGIGAQAGYMMAIDSRLQAERLTRTGDEDLMRIITEAGGPGRFGIGQMETLVRWGLSGQGMLGMTAMLGGYNGAGGLLGMLGAAGDLVSGNPMILPAMSIQLPRIIGAIGQEGTEELTLRAIKPMIDLAKIMPGSTDSEGRIHWDVVAGLVSQQLNISPDKATALVKGAMAIGGGPTRQEMAGQDIVSMLQTEADINTSIPFYKKAWYNAMYELDKTLDIGVVNRAGEAVGDFFERTVTGVSDFFTGRKTFRTEELIRDNDVRKEFSNFQNSALMTSIETDVERVLAGKTAKDSEERRRILAQAADREYKTFLSQLEEEDKGLYKSLAGDVTDTPSRTKIVRPDLDEETKNVFKRFTLGMGYHDKEETLKDVIGMTSRGFTPEQVQTTLDHRRKEYVSDPPDKTTKAYKDAIDYAWEKVNVHVISESDTPDQARDKLARSGYNGRSYDELTDLEKSALNERINEDSYARKIAGGTVAGVTDQRTAIRNQMLVNASKSIDTGLGKLRNSTMDEALALGEKYAEGVGAREVSTGLLGLGGKVTTNEFIGGAIKDIFADLERDYSRGDVTTIAEMDDIISDLRDRDDDHSKAMAMAWQAVRNASKTKGYTNTQRLGVMAKARIQLQTTIDEQTKSLRISEIQDDDARLSAQRAIEQHAISATAAESNIQIFGEVQEGRMEALMPGITDRFRQARSADDRMKVMREDVSRSLSAQSILEARSPGILQTLGIGRDKDEKVMMTMDTLLRMLDGDGIPIYDVNKKTGFSFLFPALSGPREDKP